MMTKSVLVTRESVSLMRCLDDDEDYEGKCIADDVGK